ncbi:hypothetical protein HAV15_008856 [Penicillium sp. str. |nr:hypothetical protein HAV15_008856 [Penicillium sp. str. \
MDILGALEALRNASDDLLYAHTKEAVSTIREIQFRLEKVPLEPLIRQSDGSTSRSRKEPRSITSTAGEQQDRITILPRYPGLKGTVTGGRGTQRSSLLFVSLMKEVPWMWDYTQKKPNEAIRAYRKQERIDIRLRDIQRVDGTLNPTNEDRLFRGIAQRSLALQFSMFESQFPETRRSRREGLIPTFVKDCLRTPDQTFAKQCIQAGQKQLKTEKALRVALGQKDEPTAGTGVSALTALTITPFKNLRLGEIPSFIEQLFLDSAKIDLPLHLPATESWRSTKRPFQILEILKQFSNWLNKFQNYYDDTPSNLQPMPSNPPLGKDMEDSSTIVSLAEDHSTAGSSPKPFSPSTHHTDCTSFLDDNGSEQAEDFAQSTTNISANENILTEHASSAPNMPTAGTMYTQWADTALENPPTRAFDSSPCSQQETGEACRKRRRTQVNTYLPQTLDSCLRRIAVNPSQPDDRPMNYAQPFEIDFFNQTVGDLGLQSDTGGYIHHSFEYPDSHLYELPAQGFQATTELALPFEEDYFSPIPEFRSL